MHSLEDDRRWSLQKLQAHTCIDQATVHKILREDLHMRKIAAKWVPHALTEQQKWCRYKTCRIHLERYQNEGANFLNNIITVDETCVRAYEPELKRQSAEWSHEESPRRQKFRQNPSPVKLMVILAYDVQGVILCHMVKLLMHSTVLHICEITTSRSSTLIMTNFSHGEADGIRRLPYRWRRTLLSLGDYFEGL